MINNRPCEVDKIILVSNNYYNRIKKIGIIKLIGTDCINNDRCEIIGIPHTTIDTFEPNKKIYEPFHIEDKGTFIILECMSRNYSFNNVVIKKDDLCIKLCDLKKK